MTNWSLRQTGHVLGRDRPLTAVVTRVVFYAGVKCHTPYSGNDYFGFVFRMRMLRCQNGLYGGSRFANNDFTVSRDS